MHGALSGCRAMIRATARLPLPGDRLSLTALHLASEFAPNGRPIWPGRSSMRARVYREMRALQSPAFPDPMTVPTLAGIPGVHRASPRSARRAPPSQQAAGPAGEACRPGCSRRARPTRLPDAQGREALTSRRHFVGASLAEQPPCKRNSEVILSWLSVGDTTKFGTYLACSTSQRADERGRGVWRSIGMSIYDAVG